MRLVEIYRWAHAECNLPKGSYERLMYGFVVQKLGELYGIKDLTWEHAIEMNPSGGMIGYGDSCPWLHKFLKRCKVCQVHAIFHDAMGFLYKAYGIGHGYDYVLSCLPSCPLSGQFTGLLYWSYQYLRRQL